MRNQPAQKQEKVSGYLIPFLCLGKKLLENEKHESYQQNANSSCLKTGRGEGLSPHIRYRKQAAPFNCNNAMQPVHK